MGGSWVLLGSCWGASGIVVLCQEMPQEDPSFECETRVWPQFCDGVAFFFQDGLARNSLFFAVGSGSIMK